MTRALGMFRRWAWSSWYLLAFGVALVPYFFTGDGLARGSYFDVLAASGVVAMVTGIRWRRPSRAGSLWLIAAGQAVLVAGDVFPGPSDALYLVGSALQIAGMVWLVRQRIPGRDRTSLIDAAIVSSGLALLAWIYLVRPAAMGPADSMLATAVGVSHPLIDLFLLMLLVRLLTGDGLRNRSTQLVAVAQILFVVVDTFWSLVYTGGFASNPFVSHLMQAAFLCVYAICGAAMLHPSVDTMTRPAVADTSVDLSGLRLASLVGAVMTAPVLLVVNAARGGTLLGDAIAIAAGCTLMFLLVVARMQVMVTTVRSLADVLTTQAVELEGLTQEDQLTGLANRRAWDAALPAGLDRARGDGTPTTVAIIDLDNFKRYNDTHGHQAGDRLLKEAAAAWTAQRRTVDVLARYGGEEFAILLPNCDATAAEAVLLRMREAHPAGESFSAGIAMWDGAESSEHLVARADRALYSAKKAGRDRFAQATSNAKPSAFLAHSWGRD